MWLRDSTVLDSVDVDAVDGVKAAMHYVRERFRLIGPLPGAAVEQHGEVFTCWEPRP